MGHLPGVEDRAEKRKKQTKSALGGEVGIDPRPPRRATPRSPFRRRGRCPDRLQALAGLVDFVIN